MKNIEKFIRTIRAELNRRIYPFKGYWLASRSEKPMSRKFGYDRGTPIDRYWIESFLHKHKDLIKGHCLEVTDNSYTIKFGGDAVTRPDVLDIDRKNKKATIIGDLRNLNAVIQDNTYDCIILTHVLGLIDELDKALEECRRILKEGGTMLITSSCLSPTYKGSNNYWRFTPLGAEYLLGKHFGEQNVSLVTYGNAFTGQCFWVGMAQEDLSPKELDKHDPEFPCVIGIKVTKKK